MKIYHLTILGYYNNPDGTHQTTVTCNGMTMRTYDAGYYEFWVKDKHGGLNRPVALYPIRKTIITSIEDINKEQ